MDVCSRAGLSRRRFSRCRSSRHSGRSVGAVFAAALLLPALVGSAPASAAPATSPADTESPFAEIPDVWPQPQSLEERSGTLTIPDRVVVVTGERTDRPALRVVREVLRAAGVDRIQQVDADGDIPQGPLTVYVGSPDANAAVPDALAALGVEGPGGLPGEGYVLAADRDSRGRNLIVASGADGDGTFYAAQTLRQLVVTRDDTSKVHALVVRDRPAMELRGVIEGFYGQPWSHEERLSQLEFYGRTKQNIYVYSPKDDPYLREKWRKPYPSERKAKIAELVETARANHVAFTYALSPGLSICYSSGEDLRALVGKFESMWEIGVRSFAIPLDDISYTNWNCEADEQKFGTGPAAAGRAQSYLLNRVQQRFIEPHKDEGIARLQTVPTEYYNVADSPYKEALRTHLDEDVVVEWTGVGVIADDITAEQAEAATQVFGHDILVWDNYPVNDYVDARLLLGPYVGRQPGIAEHLAGVTANPMVQAEASKIAEFTSGAFLWNPDSYQPKQAWLAALRAVGGDAWKWLQVLAENSYSSILQPKESLTLSPLIADFWAAYESGDGLDPAARALRDYFATMAATPGKLRDQLDNRDLLAEIEPWANKLGHYGQAGQHAVRMLLAIRAGDGETAWAQRQAMRAGLDRAHAVRVPVSGVEPKVAPGVFSPFAQRALSTVAEWLGVVGVAPTTSMGTYSSYGPENMVDGDPDTFYWTSGPPAPGDYVGVDLGAVRDVSRIRVAMSKPSSPHDYIHDGVLEVSSDGQQWTAIGEYSGQAEIEATAPEGTEARYVRLRATSGQRYWVVVREFSVVTPGGVELSASGAPPAADGSGLAHAVDGDLDSAYVAARKPRDGEALTVDFSTAKSLESVTILQSAGQPAGARVEVRTGGSWQPVGTLDGGYTSLGADGATATALRLLWAEDSPAPRVHEVVPRFAAD